MPGKHKQLLQRAGRMVEAQKLRSCGQVHSYFTASAQGLPLLRGPSALSAQPDSRAQVVARWLAL